MKQLKEQEQIRKQKKYMKWQNHRVKKSDEAMKKSIRQVLCRRMHNCRNKETMACFRCIHNKALAPNNIYKDYYKERIPGVRYL